MTSSSQSMAGGGTTGGMANSPQNMASGGMASGGAGGMADAPKSHHNAHQRQDQDQEYKASFISRFFFQDDLRILELKLQSIGPSKKDVIDTNAFSISEYGFFQLYFKMFPVISINILGVIISIILYLSLIQISIIFAIIVSFLFMQLIILPNAKIVYSLDQFKIGEKETGRFINVVRKMWHLFEFKMVLLTIGIGILNLIDIDFDAIANKLNEYQTETAFVNNLLFKVKQHIDFPAIAKIAPDAISGLLILFLFAIIFYAINTYLVFSKYKDQYEKNVFSIKKEFMNPADLAREKFKF